MRSKKNSHREKQHCHTKVVNSLHLGRCTHDFLTIIGGADRYKSSLLCGTLDGYSGT